MMYVLSILNVCLVLFTVVPQHYSEYKLASPGIRSSFYMACILYMLLETTLHFYVASVFGG